MTAVSQPPRPPQLTTLSTISSIASDKRRLDEFYVSLHARLTSPEITGTNAFTTIKSLATLRAKLLNLDEKLPLYGVPFTVKDNIDVMGELTTCGIKGSTNNNSDVLQRATTSADIVMQLESLGAVLVAKTNMDTYATGLVGTRSSGFGVVSNVHDRRYVSGGSSSGAAASVAFACCALAVGTDTAGSGRVPAAMQGIVGVKPTKGLLCMAGVVPACKSLDCLSLFCASVADGRRVLKLLETDTRNKFDELYLKDGWMRYNSNNNNNNNSNKTKNHDDDYDDDEDDQDKYEENEDDDGDNKVVDGFHIYIPQQKYLSFQYNNNNNKEEDNLVKDSNQDLKSKCSFNQTINLLTTSSNINAKLFNTTSNVDLYAPFAKVSAMLYNRSFVSERYTAVGRHLPTTSSQVNIDASVHAIITNAVGWRAWELFQDLDDVRTLMATADVTFWKHVDVLVVPTVPAVYSVEDVLNDPINTNSTLGLYTNFVNLMDYCAIAVPGVDVLATDGDGQSWDNVPRGVTFIAKAFNEDLIFSIAGKLEQAIAEHRRQHNK